MLTDVSTTLADGHDHLNHNIDSPGFKPFTVINIIYCIVHWVSGQQRWRRFFGRDQIYLLFVISI